MVVHPLALLSFSRPHTLLGTFTAVPAIGIHAAGSPAFGAIPAALLANLYVTGLNQITDVEVDHMNKPYLCIPSGRLSMCEAKVVVGIAGVLALTLSSGSKALFATVFSSMALGTLYSMNPFRWKRFPLLAAASIVLVRGVIVNIGFASHAAGALAVPTGPVLFFSAFALAIAILKDVPDMKGDFMFKIPSFALSYGRSAACRVSAALLVVALGITGTFVPPWLTAGAIAMSSAIIQCSIRAEVEGTVDAFADLYQFYWKCFYVCYVSLFFV